MPVKASSNAPPPREHVEKLYRQIHGMGQRPTGVLDPRLFELPGALRSTNGLEGRSGHTSAAHSESPHAESEFRRIHDAHPGGFAAATQAIPSRATVPSGSTQNSREAFEGLGTDTIARAMGSAGIGGNLPTIPKRATLFSPEAKFTSPNALLARSLPFARTPLPKGWKIKTLNYRGGLPRSPNWGSALGRAAGPMISVPLLGYDLYTSDNKVRTAIADGFGILGSAVGGTIGASGGPAGIGAGLLGGGYVGNAIGAGVYDAFSHPELFADPAFLAVP